MSTRYDDRDDRDYDRDSAYYGQYNRASSLDNTRSFGERAENRWGENRGGEGRYGEGRYGESGRGYGGSSYGRGGSYSSGGRESERYDREGRERRSGGRSYGRESSSGGGRESGREGYWGRGWENERDDDRRESRYGSYGRSGAERGYSEGMRDYSSQGYNYPTGSRSTESYGERGRSYGQDRERYDRGEDRGWWDRASDTVASWFGDEEAEQRRRMDQQREHRGRGPKGYRRSDERIKEDVNDRLSDDYYVDASEVEVMVTNTEVTLTGTVNSREEKRRAEDIAESVSGVTNVENRLRVKQGRYGDYSTTSTSTGASMGTTGTGTGTASGTGISGTPGSTTSSAAAGGGKSSNT
ncbi:MAG TPA: BON domain-containing protein [Pyrinomonadaceae bacterium]|nr:BON domain-containing protein [Pyrinomonadaceae bacterium]